MHDVPPLDGGNRIDWSRTSGDYAAHRPNYPDRFFEEVHRRGVGTRGQDLLDLGTGVGFLALTFAAQGARVTGVDVAEGQIAGARRIAADRGLEVKLFVAPAEETGLPDGAFDVVTASQCWLYFDAPRMIPEVKRMLRPQGLLMTSHLCWLPREDDLARASEELVLAYNPNWTAADWAGVIPETPSWAEGHFDVVDRLVFDEDVAFTRESWRGRMRACRGVGATLSPDEVERFDAAHDELLRDRGAEAFTVRHRIDAHFLRPRR